MGNTFLELRDDEIDMVSGGNPIALGVMVGTAASLAAHLIIKAADAVEGDTPLLDGPNVKQASGQCHCH
jgi:hypothetical protein